MEKPTTGQRAKIIEFYFRNECFIIRTQRAYTCYFNDKSPPAKLAIHHLVQRFQQQGSVGDSPRTGRPRSVRMEENIERSQGNVHEEPGTSIRRRSR